VVKGTVKHIKTYLLSTDNDSSMPRYQMTAHFSLPELKNIDDLCQEKGWLKEGKPNHYLFLRKAALAYCESCQKEKKQDEREGTKSTGESLETVGRAKRETGESSNPSGEATDIIRAVNHAEADDIGFG
jgi:hypothetical protein